MPIVEVFLRRGRTPEQIQALTEALHDALVDTYDVPRGDRFQIVRQCEPYELIFDSDFMGGPRTENFVLVRITAGRPRPPHKKRDLFAAIAANLQSRARVDPADVLIVTDHVGLTGLSLSGGRPYDLEMSRR
ncbi:tautomerase family protein [Mycobacterium paraintracellulare]|uniref:tautomerase family protein n=1 Tax=Mycobacterium paraintracellulare TaxID=1138383 RepID=UPI001915735B|nr:tautomerase family protein [Mycobacterium paraintracellulare]